MQNTRKQAERIVEAVLDELRDRKGLNSLLEQIEDDRATWRDFYEALVERVVEEL